MSSKPGDSRFATSQPTVKSSIAQSYESAQPDGAAGDATKFVTTSRSNKKWMRTAAVHRVVCASAVRVVGRGGCVDAD